MINKAPPLNTAVIYARFSSDNQRQESIDAQIRACRKYAKDKNLLIVDTYIDEAKSATTADREGFQNMISDSKEKKFAFVIVHKLDRFSRDRYDSVNCKMLLKKNGVVVLSVLENLDGSPESVMLEALLEAQAEYYSKNLAREVKKGLFENALTCRHTGGSPPLGYDVDKATKKYVVNEAEADTVKLIFEMYTTGYGYKEILRHLNNTGHTTKTGKKFGTSSLNTILKNEKYTGVYIYNLKKEKGLDGKRRPTLNPDEEIIRKEGGMPEIIDKGTFLKAQHNLAKNLKNGGKHKAIEYYLLSGLIFCGECGASLYGNCRYCGRNKNKYITYRCSNRAQKKGCVNKEMNKIYIENYVLDELSKNLFNESSIKILAKELTDYNKKINVKNNANLTKAENDRKSKIEEINRILDVVIKGGVNIDIISKKLQELEEKKNYLDNHIHEITIQNSLAFTEEMVLDLVDKSKEFVKTKNIAECRFFIESYIERVDLYHDRLEVTYKIQVPTDDGELTPLKSVVDRETLLRDYKQVV